MLKTLNPCIGMHKYMSVCACVCLCMCVNVITYKCFCVSVWMHPRDYVYLFVLCDMLSERTWIRKQTFKIIKQQKIYVSMKHRREFNRWRKG